MRSLRQIHLRVMGMPTGAGVLVVDKFQAWGEPPDRPT
jgi:hypothetical protein